MLGVVRENAQTFSKLNQSRFLRALNQHFWYFGHEMSDYVTKVKWHWQLVYTINMILNLGKFLNKPKISKKI